MDSLQKDFFSLIKESHSLLKEQKEDFFFCSPTEFSFFQEVFPLEKKIKSRPVELKPLDVRLIEKKPEQVLEKPLKSAPLQKKEIVLEKSSVEEKLKEKTFREPFSLEPSFSSFQTVKTSLLKVFPHFKILEQIPDDAEAKEIAQEWKYFSLASPIVLFATQEIDPKALSFLQNLAKALNACFEPTKLLYAESFEKENHWQFFLSSKKLKLILLYEEALFKKLPLLLKHLKNYPARAENFLETVPVCLLPDPALYFKQPSQKAILWETLSQKLLSSTP